MSQKHPVLIIGAGPVGLSLAYMLAQRHHAVEVFEALPELSPQDRANTFHPPVLELFNSWGILDELLADGETVRELQYWKREGPKLVAAFSYDLIRDFTDFPYRLHIPQHRIGQSLQSRLEESGLVNINFAHRLQDYTDHGTHIEALFQTADDEQITVEGSHIIGADGARSFVRELMGVSFKGKIYADRFLIVDSDAQVNQFFHNIGPLSYVFDPQEWAIIQAMKHLTRFTLRVQQGEDSALITKSSEIYARLDRFIPNLSHNIKHAAIYEVWQGVASSFAKGRAALAGDAAHLTNPIGGKGLNSGILDAYELAQQLDLIFSGQSDNLDAYSQKQRQIAQEHINPASEIDYTDMCEDEHHAIANRDDKFHEIATDLKLARNFVLRASMLESRIPIDS